MNAKQNGLTFKIGNFRTLHPSNLSSLFFQKDKDADRVYRWQHCHLTQEPLSQSRVVACHLGGLYNKEAVLQMLIDKTEKVPHIKSLKVNIDLGCGAM